MIWMTEANYMGGIEVGKIQTGETLSSVWGRDAKKSIQASSRSRLCCSFWRDRNPSLVVGVSASASLQKKV
jgi:hypothetical protein